MAAHRYWRAVGLQAYGSAGLDVTEFQLIAGTTRVDASATLSASIAPATGSLANLQDDSTATGATWPAGNVAALFLNWDFGGSPQDVTDVRLGSATDASKFLQSCKLQWSDDGAAWTDFFAFSALEWPGARAKTASVDTSNFWSLMERGYTTSVSDDRLTVGSWSSNSAKAQTYQSAGTRQFEAVCTSIPAGANVHIGLSTNAATFTNYPGFQSVSWAYSNTGQKYNAFSAASYGATWVQGDVIGVVVNFTTGTLTFYKNGVAQGVAYSTGLAGQSLAPHVGQASSGATPALFTLKTSGFAYPIAGASDWSTPPMIRRAIAPGFAVGLVPRIPTNASAPIAFGLVNLKTQVLNARVGARGDLTGSLGFSVGRIAGTVKEDATPDVPVSRLVRLHRQKDGLKVLEQWSNKVTGAYSFDYIDEKQTYYVLSFDHNKNFRAVVADNLAPTLMPGEVSSVVPAVYYRSAGPTAAQALGTTMYVYVPPVADGDTIFLTVYSKSPVSYINTVGTFSIFTKIQELSASKGGAPFYLTTFRATAAASMSGANFLVGVSGASDVMQAVITAFYSNTGNLFVVQSPTSILNDAGGSSQTVPVHMAAIANSYSLILFGAWFSQGGATSSTSVTDGVMLSNTGPVAGDLRFAVAARKMISAAEFVTGTIGLNVAPGAGQTAYALSNLILSAAV
jgi:hypothetical protein